MHSVAVMIVLQTSDPRLDPALSIETNAVREAVIEALPQLTSVMMVLPEEHARLMCAVHVIAAQSSGLENLIEMPPRSYRAPGDPIAPMRATMQRRGRR